MGMSLEERIDAFAKGLIERETRHADEIASAKAKADVLHGCVTDAIDRFNQAVAADLPHLRIAVTSPRIDGKHLHAFEFDLERGRYRGIVTIKGKGEVTLVGPFRAGKNEGPCRSFPFGTGGGSTNEADELVDALGDFIERFLEEATAP